jgi:predicted  nucleic acid-binding Zn-ribbon protein
MLQAIAQLLILQNTDQRLREVTQALLQLPQEKITCEKALRDADQKLQSIRSRQHELDREIKKNEGDILAKQGQIARYRIQQMETRKNEEYAAFNHEIALGEKAITMLEEQQLELMEKSELLQPEIERAQEVHAIEHKRVNTILGTIDGRSENLLVRQRELQNARPSLTLDIEEDVLDRYERLFKSKNGIAVAAIEHGVCTGCHMQMTTQTILSAKAEKEIMACSQCGRFLYTEED